MRIIDIPFIYSSAIPLEATMHIHCLIWWFCRRDVSARKVVHIIMKFKCQNTMQNQRKCFWLEFQTSDYFWPFSSNQTPTQHKCFNSKPYQSTIRNKLIQVLLNFVRNYSITSSLSSSQVKCNRNLSLHGPVNQYSDSENITPWCTPISVQDPSRSSNPKCITISFLADIPCNQYAHKEDWAARKITYHFAIVQMNNNAPQRCMN